jgi:hypothetical protein
LHSFGHQVLDDDDSGGATRSASTAAAAAALVPICGFKRAAPAKCHTLSSATALQSPTSGYPLITTVAEFYDQVCRMISFLSFAKF